MQGVFARYSAGAAGGDQGSVAEYPTHIAMLAQKREDDLGEELMDDEIYDHIIFLADPDLNEPVLVIALEGWIDAGLGASNAIGTLLDTIYTEVLATFDTEYFIDQRARRPIARIVDGVTTELTWPEIQLRFGRDGDGADILFLVGPEPDFHWSDFVDVVTDAAGRFDVRLVVGLGAFPAPTPHTRPVRIIGTAPRPARHLLTRVGTRHRVNSKSPPASAPRSSSASPRSTWRSSRCGPACRTTWPRCPTRRPSAALIEGLASIGRADPRRRAPCAPRPTRRASASTSSSPTTPTTRRWSSSSKTRPTSRGRVARRRAAQRRRTGGRTGAIPARRGNWLEGESGVDVALSMRRPSPSA